MAAGSQVIPAAESRTARFHRPELDALRFGAFFLVFLHHALPHASTEYAGFPLVAAQALAAIGRAGALGVDLFFALSSYLITELLLREARATGKLDVRAFYVRRILRIWPLYFFALLILAPLMSFVMRFIDPSDTMPASYTVAFLLLAGNWACVLGGYPASSFALLWSVSIEEQFYLAWPWLIRETIRTNAQPVMRVAIGMLIVASATRVLLAMNGAIHPAVWCNTLARLDPIAGGALLAFMLRGELPQWNALTRAAVLSSGTLGLFIVGGFGAHDGWGSLVTYPAAALSAVAILAGTLGLGGSTILSYLGKISFGLYVLHVAILRVVPNAFLALPLTIAVAALSYRFLESPFLRLKERFARVASRSL